MKTIKNLFLLSGLTGLVLLNSGHRNNFGEIIGEVTHEWPVKKSNEIIGSRYTIQTEDDKIYYVEKDNYEDILNKGEKVRLKLKNSFLPQNPIKIITHYEKL